jgi:hypothetical protein
MFVYSFHLLNYGKNGFNKYLFIIMSKDRKALPV